MNSFEERLELYTQEVNREVEAFLPPADSYQTTVAEAMAYSVTAGGKRLRPLIMRETYRMLGGASSEILPFMAAMEMIHTFSLVHDDLPCMDNDRYRRGRETTWVRYGEDMAVLAGDGLLACAFETACQAFADSAHPERVGRAMQILAEKTGIYGMIGGQSVDVECTGNPVDMEQLNFIYRLKTGALLEASMMIGAVMAGADEDQIRRAERVASLVGMAFQIQDDILDMTSSQEELGKPVHSDEKNQKTTYATMMGLERAGAEVERLSREAMEELSALPGERTFMEQLIISLIHRKK